MNRLQVRFREYTLKDRIWPNLPVLLIDVRVQYSPNDVAVSKMTDATRKFKIVSLSL